MNSIRNAYASIDTITLQSFIEAAATGSFTNAAERIGRTQSAVSQQILKLEKLLGKPLFFRHKTIKLTNEGELFLAYAKRIFALHLEALDCFNQSELKGEVRFGLPEDFSTVFLSDALIDFLRLHHKVTLNIECNLTLNLYERFKRKEYDLVLLKMSCPHDFPHGVEIWSEKLEWVGDESLIQNFSSTTALPLIASHQPCVYRSRAISALEDAHIKWQIVFTSPNYMGTIAALKAGLGISVLPRTMIPKDIYILKSSFLPSLSDTHISLLKHDPQNLAVRSLENFVIKKLNH